MISLMLMYAGTLLMLGILALAAFANLSGGPLLVVCAVIAGYALMFTALFVQELDS